METVFKVDKREPEGGPYLSDKNGPPPPQAGREGARGREAKSILKQLAEGEGEGGPYLSDKSCPPSKEDRHLEIAYQGGYLNSSLNIPAR